MLSVTICFTYKSKFSLYRCITPKRATFASMYQGNTASFDEVLLRWRIVGNALCPTSSRFKLRTTRFRQERFTIRQQVCTLLLIIKLIKYFCPQLDNLIFMVFDFNLGSYSNIKNESLLDLLNTFPFPA